MSRNPRPSPSRRLLLLPALVLAAACPSVQMTGPTPDGGSGSGSGGRGGGGSSGGPDGSVDRGRDLVSSTDLMVACATESSEAMPTQLDILLVTDSSLSMMNNSKWDAVKGALTAFIDDQGSAGLGVGIVYFPHLVAGPPAECTTDGPCGTSGPCDRRQACVGAGTQAMVTGQSTLCASAANCPASEPICALIYTTDPCATSPTSTACEPTIIPCVTDGAPCPGNPFKGYCRGRDIQTPASYATLDVDVANLPGAATNLKSSLNARAVGGFTPTGPAVEGAITYAQQRMQAMRNHRVAIVLVTDGLPGGINPAGNAEVDRIAGVLAAAAAATPPVTTFVVGVFTDATRDVAQITLDKLARGGGQQQALIVTTSQNIAMLLQQELSRIREVAVLPCEYQIPTTMAMIDFDKVNVDFTAAGATTATRIGYAGVGPASCDATRGGWYYDMDPMTARPTRITACPVSCTLLQGGAGGGRVDIVFGCPTIGID
jgi:hypothetical protein